MDILKLKNPLDIDGDKVTEIEYDFEAVKPIEYINIVKRLSKKESISVPEVNMDVQIAYFAKASGITVGDLKRMESVQDFNEMLSRTRNFLLNISEEETEEETNSSEQ